MKKAGSRVLPRAPFLSREPTRLRRPARRAVTHTSATRVPSSIRYSPHQQFLMAAVAPSALSLHCARPRQRAAARVGSTALSFSPRAPRAPHYSLSPPAAATLVALAPEPGAPGGHPGATLAAQPPPPPPRRAFFASRGADKMLFFFACADRAACARCLHIHLPRLGCGGRVHSGSRGCGPGADPGRRSGAGRRGNAAGSICGERERAVRFLFLIGLFLVIRVLRPL